MNNIFPFITHHWQLCALLTLVVLLIAINEWLSNKKQSKALSASQMIDLMNHHHAVIFDLRSLDAYQQGHIIGARRVSEDDFEHQRMEKYKQKSIILVCEQGIVSAKLATKLQKMGFTQPLLLKGGIKSWLAEQLPLVKGK